MCIVGVLGNPVLDFLLANNFQSPSFLSPGSSQLPQLLQSHGGQKYVNGGGKALVSNVHSRVTIFLLY